MIRKDAPHFFKCNFLLNNNYQISGPGSILSLNKKRGSKTETLNREFIYHVKWILSGLQDPVYLFKNILIVTVISKT